MSRRQWRARRELELGTTLESWTPEGVAAQERAQRRLELAAEREAWQRKTGTAGWDRELLRRRAERLAYSPYASPEIRDRALIVLKADLP